ncbi:SDR family NAD(P)-dependent oxidoreductase [Phormidium tenue FACHB-886]|nr:SDR family NAD(P)-dependent oxidoreductase [Phormidium tenue FACHB-886]
MDLQLGGKRALVTGSSGGIGEGIVKTLAKEGVAVVVQGRKEQQANRVAQEITASGGKAFVALGDLSKDEDAQRVAEAALAALGGIDILVNNAGGYEQVDWMASSPSKWADMFNHDVLSMVRLVQHLAPQMKELGWGRFIQISSSAGVQPYAFGPDYSAAKAAINNLSVSLAKDLAGTGITSNTISPGPIMTVGFEQLWRGYAKTKGWSDDWDEIERNVVREVLPNPTGRVGRIEEVASLVALVASPLGGYINGANLRVDGGYVVGVN